MYCDPTFNKCPGPCTKSRLCSDGHCPNYDYQLCPVCPVLRWFYNDWYIGPTGVVPTPILSNLNYGPNNTSKSLIQYCPSFFSLGRKDLVQGLWFATTDSNPNLFASDVLANSFLKSLMLLTNSQFDSLDKFYRVESTSLQTLFPYIVSLRYDLCLRVYYLL